MAAGRGARQRQRRNPPPPRRGYVLLLTLLVLALAATVTAGVCRASYARAARSVRAEEELRRRWGVLSCQQTFLPLAKDVLARDERLRGRPVAAARTRVVLSGRPLDLLFADEAAKLDLNAVVQRQAKGPAEAAAKDLLRQAGNTVPVRLLAGRQQKARPIKKPAPPAPGAPAPPNQANPDEPDEARPLQSFGQIFPDADPADLVGTIDRPGAAAELTCWGDGRLNFTRASAGVLRQVCRPALSAAQAARLVRLREQSPSIPPAELLEQLQLPEDVESEVGDRLDEESACHSLWVVAVTPNRSWYYFAVLDDTGATAQAAYFSW